MTKTTKIALVFAALLVLAKVASAVTSPAAAVAVSARVNPSPIINNQCSTVTLNGSVETILSGLAPGGCFRINTNGKDVYFFGEPTTGFDAGTADATQARLPDPGVEIRCLLGAETKIHFFAAAATTATVCQTGP